MALQLVDACIGPVAFVCQVTAASQDAASDYVLGGLGSAFIGGAAQVGELALAALDSTTTIDLGVGWFRANVSVMAAIALPVVVGSVRGAGADRGAAPGARRTRRGRWSASARRCSGRASRSPRRSSR